MTLLESRKKLKIRQFIKIIIGYIFILLINYAIFRFALRIQMGFTVEQIEFFIIIIWLMTSFAFLTGIWIQSQFKPESLDNSLKFLGSCTKKAIIDYLTKELKQDDRDKSVSKIVVQKKRSTNK